MAKVTEDYIQFYSQDIRKAAYFYGRMTPAGKKCGVDELIQAGRIAVWKVSERHPEKAHILPYVRAAIRYGIFGEMKKVTRRVPEINVVRIGGEYKSFIDLLPSHEDSLNEKIEVDDLCHQISKDFSLQEADSLKQLVSNSRSTLLNLDLTNSSEENLKKRVRLVTSMDLSDGDMLMYARVLVGEKKVFPQNFVSGRNDRMRKYVKFILKDLGISAEEFAGMYGPRQGILECFRLGGFSSTLYNGNMLRLVSDVFPQVEPYKIKYRGRWQGIEGLVNAYDALGGLRVSTGKIPCELSRRDFRNFGIEKMLRSLFDNSIFLAIEFRWPGTWKGSSESKKAEELWKGLEDLL